MSDTTAKSRTPWGQMLAWSALPVVLIVASGIAILRNGTPPGPAAKVLVKGGVMHGAEGLTFGPDGMMYVASMNGLSIVKVDPKTGAVTTLVSPPDGQADDVAVGPADTPAAGIVVWTDPPAGLLHVLRPGGTPEILMRDVPRINPVAFRKDGRLVAAQSGANDNALWEVDPFGKTPPRLISQGKVQLNGFDFGPDGKLYAPWQTTDQLVRIDIDTGETTVVARNVGLPVGVDVDSKGNIYSVDSTNGDLWQTTPAGESKVLLHREPPFDNVCVGPDDTVYATLVADSIIVAVNPETGAARDLVSGAMVTPLGLQVTKIDGKDTLLVADPFGYRRVDVTTGAVSRGPWRRNRDAGLAIAANDRFLAILGTTGVVKKIDRTSDEVVGEFPAIAGARGVAMTPAGDIFVADVEGGRILRLDAAGPRTLAEGLRHPVSLSLDGPNLLVAEADGLVSRIDIANGARTELAKELSTPVAAARMPNGWLVVLQAGSGAVTAIDPRGTRKDLATGVALDVKGLRLPADAAAGLAVGPDGAIYVSAPREMTILKIGGGPS